MSFLSGISSAFSGGIGGIASSIMGAVGAHQAGNQMRDAARQGYHWDQHAQKQLIDQFKPWTSAGANATNQLQYDMGIGSGAGHSGYGSLLKGYGQHVPDPFHYQGQAAPGAFNPTKFEMPSLQDFYKNSPAYAFQKQQGMQGVLNGGASSGGALSGAAQKDLMGFNQGLANTAWDNYYQQKLAGQQERYGQQLGTYEGQLQGYNSQYGNQLAGYGANLHQQEQGFNQYNTQQGNIYNRLLALSGMGEQAQGQLAGNETGLSTDIAQGMTNAGMGQAWGTKNMWGSLQSGAQQAGSMPWDQLSDRRLKKDIEQIGTDTNGLPVYRFRYLWDSIKSAARIGYMADEVKKLFSEAVRTNSGGYHFVNYQRVAELSEAG